MTVSVVLGSFSVFVHGEILVTVRSKMNCFRAPLIGLKECLPLLACTRAGRNGN